MTVSQDHAPSITAVTSGQPAPGKHRIWLEPQPGGPNCEPLAGGWYTGRSHPTHGFIGMNEQIYGRWPTTEHAAELSRALAVETIQGFRRSGWACRADPPITVTY